MSFFGRGQQQAPSQNLALMVQEIDLTMRVFNNLLSTCHRKCIPTEYVQGELNKGESVCVDRCVMKYFAVQTKVMDFQKNQALQQQSMA